MNTADVDLFLVISESDSLAQAARRLDIPPMLVSRRLAQLEKITGKRLVHRTTRAISLTQEGIEFLPYARTIVEAEAGARALFHSGKKGAGGLLRITAPSGLGRRNIIPLIPALLSDNPELRIDLQLSDEVVDIVGRGIDVAIRVAPLRDSSLVARKLIDNPRILCASSDYLKRRGVPVMVSDLVNHDCLRLSSVPQWVFEKKDKTVVQVPVEGRFTSSNVEGIRELCTDGHGLVQLTLLDVKRELESGILTEVTLCDAEPQQLSGWAVLPTARFVPQRVSAFIDALKQDLNEIRST